MAVTRFTGPVQSDGGFVGPGLAIITNNDAIANLSLTASETYDDGEIQGVANKVDEILAMLRTAGIIKGS